MMITPAFAQKPPIQEWPFYGGDQGGMKYSPLDQINRSNLHNLQRAWEWKPGEDRMEEFKTTPGNFQATPLMIDNVLYLSTSYNRVAALDAETGKELWVFDPKSYVDGQVPNGTGWVHRGIAVWRDASKSGRPMRILLNTRHRLMAIDAKTGTLVKEFGDNGIVNLLSSLRYPIDPKHYTNTSPSVVYKDLVIVGNGVADRLIYKNDPPGDIRAFHAKTGKLMWTFHTVPQKGEVGYDTWKNGSAEFTGHTNIWAPMTLDAERGLLYLPVSTPSNDFYGGRRLGSNLFADSLVCLDAANGKRKWHFQTVHHGLWDYDLPGPPSLVTIHVNGRKIDAVVQLTKTGFAFVFDRLTGVPVWPIEERPVPRSDVPGEEAWPTQPFPTKPPAFSPQGVTLDDAFDLTPALKAEAQAEMKKYHLGPMFTPPSLDGMLMVPGIIGGANWGGGAFDPETGILYVKSSHSPGLVRLAKPGGQIPNNDSDYSIAGSAGATFHNGLPLLKPPYGHMTAIDLNKGEFAWRVPFGDDDRVRNHPALKDVAIPVRLGAAGAPGSIVTKGGLVIAGGGDRSIRMLDKSDGKELWSHRFDVPTTATPMTYRAANGRQYVVIATGSGKSASLVAFALAE